MKYNYNWDNYLNVIDYLNILYNNTFTYLKDNNYSELYAYEFVSYVEDFLYYFKINNYNVSNIVNKIKDIELIEFYDSFYANDNYNDVFELPPVLNKGTKILLNVSITGNKRLSSKERRRLYLYQGLIHSIFSFKNKKTIMFSKMYNRYLDNNSNIIEITINNGWLLLEDTLSQELAEKTTYSLLNKVRPRYKNGLEDEVYPISSNKISSNLEMYRMFQEIIIHFGLTLNKLEKMINNSNKFIINDLLKYAIENDFSLLVMSEYRERNITLELYQLLYLMGLLINEKYRMYHINFLRYNKLSISDIDKIYDNIISLCDSLVKYKNTITDDNIIVLYDENIKKKIKKLIQDKEI